MTRIPTLAAAATLTLAAPLAVVTTPAPAAAKGGDVLIHKSPDGGADNAFKIRCTSGAIFWVAEGRSSDEFCDIASVYVPDGLDIATRRWSSVTGWYWLVKYEDGWSGVSGQHLAVTWAD